jgi:hypothetical protein
VVMVHARRRGNGQAGGRDWAGSLHPRP